MDIHFKVKVRSLTPQQAGADPKLAAIPSRANALFHLLAHIYSRDEHLPQLSLSELLAAEVNILRCLYKPY